MKSDQRDANERVEEGERMYMCVGKSKREREQGTREKKGERRFRS